MYPKYFGLKEPSFSISPDPQYLFLSGQHREALAHLLYGAGEGGGFVLLSGEVGTGKTTVCRAFLEQLPQDVDVALVLNPAMTAAELLHAICDEFRAELPPGEPSVKTMLDQLNRFLLDAHARGRRPVLIIDEAQNLRPKVLEQIRLLTNLETSKQKLLQIFLIGQPELRALLASPDLRQLNQRITARYHLQPLTAKETAAYIDHRIAVAGVDRPLFTPAAQRRVHRVTGGVPRLINLVCDRSLLGAAVSRRMQVTPQIVGYAAGEVIDRHNPARSRRRGMLGIAAALAGALALGVWIGGADLPSRLPAEWLALVGQEPPAPRVAEAKPVATEPADPEAAAEPDLAEEPPAQELPPLAIARVSLADGAVPVDAQAGVRDNGATLDASSTPTATDAPASALAAGDAGATDAEPEPGPAIQTGADTAPEEPNDVAPIAVADRVSDAADIADIAAAAMPEVPATSPVAVAAVTAPPPEEVTTPAAAAVPRIAATKVSPQVPTLDEDQLTSALVQQDEVVDELLRLWQVQTAPGVRFLDCAAVPAFALACERNEGRWSDLRRFNRPAALKLLLPNDEEGFAVVAGLDEEHALLQRNGDLLRVPIATLDERWSGDYLLLWRPPPFGGKVIGVGTSADAVAWLRERLALLPGSALSLDPARYDVNVIAAVRNFQGLNGLVTDGIAGPRTLIMLSNALADLDVPRLSHNR